MAAVQHAADTQGERDLEATFFPLARGWSWDALGQEHEAEPGPAWALPTLANGIRSQESLCDPRQVSEPIPAQPKNQDWKATHKEEEWRQPRGEELPPPPPPQLAP